MLRLWLAVLLVVGPLQSHRGEIEAALRASDPLAALGSAICGSGQDHAPQGPEHGPACPACLPCRAPSLVAGALPSPPSLPLAAGLVEPATWTWTEPSFFVDARPLRPRARSPPLALEA